MSYRKYKKPMGKKPLSTFTPHSLASFQETQENEPIRKLLININLYHSVLKKVPPLEYLSFVLNHSICDIKKALGYLSHNDWFSIVVSRGKYSYHLTDKFQNAFYHPDRGQK